MTSNRPISILTVTSELPWPLNSGGHLRTFHVLKSLATTFDVRLVVPVPAADEPQNREAIEVLSGHKIQVIPVRVPPRTRLAEARRLLRARWLGEPYVLYRRHARPEMLAGVAEEIRRRPPDVLFLDHLDGFLFHHPDIPAILDLHNIYSLILNRMADEAKSPLKRLFFRGEAKRLARIESRACGSGFGLLAVSQTEAEHFRKLGSDRVTIAPNGVDCQAFAELPTGRSMNPLRILYLGTLSWGPNVSAAVYLAEVIFPKVRELRPDAELILVGKDPSAEVRAFAGRSGITVTGSVPSIQPYLRDSSLLAVPLDSGGGTRLKILEAFAAGIPVVSTKVGAEGIDATHGREIIITERDAFAEAILDLAQKPELAQTLANNARSLAQNVYDWSRVGATIIQTIQEMPNLQTKHGETK